MISSWNIHNATALITLLLNNINKFPVINAMEKLKSERYCRPTNGQV